MPLVSLNADPDQDPERMHALIRRAQAESTDPVLVVYGQKKARIYYEGEKSAPSPKPRG